MSLYISYLIPILFLVIHKIRGFPIPYGPFKLPRGLGLPTNVFALSYGIFIAIWLPFPPAVPVDAVSMNYGGPVLGFVILLAILDWFIGGKRRFSVPVEVRYGEDDTTSSTWSP